MKFLILLGCLIIAVSPCAVSNLNAAEQAFKAEGILQQYNGSSLGQTYGFTALVDDCRWFIHTVPEKSPGLEYYEDSYDGAYVYHYLQFSGILQTNAANSSGGEIVASDIPNNKADYAVATWLAYGSSCYFNKVKENKVKPFFDWFESNESELNTLIAVDLKRSEKPPFIPTFIYAKDYNRRYRVIDFTNFEGLLLPNRLLKNDFFGIFYSKSPMILRVIFQKHGFFNSLLKNLLLNVSSLILKLEQIYLYFPSMAC